MLVFNMKEIYIKSIRKLRQNKEEIESKLKVKITIKGTNVFIKGHPPDEYFAERVILALDFPFLPEDAFLLMKEDYLFEVISIKANTKRTDFEVIKGRIIGIKRKTLKVLETLTNSIFAVKGNNVAIIAPANEMQKAHQAIISLIHGSKQGNVYAHLEKARKAQTGE